ncbi:hypothetical protein ACHAWU_003674 [Discostella pseudostelligera]|uniref:Uncharacterized protein n=1 Tax=Discostella pseudostelligera TaxID=259834 RepID=A0ABD3MD96_9STRA
MNKEMGSRPTTAPREADITGKANHDAHVIESTTMHTALSTKHEISKEGTLRQAETTIPVEDE